MSKIIYGVAIIVLLSCAYYFAFFLPKVRNYEMQQKCAQSAQEFMKNENFGGDSAKYECHFNEHLNRCFVSIEATNLPSKTMAYTLVDVFENKDYGSCLEIEYKTYPLSCWMVNQKGGKNSYPNYYEWKDASKEYMSK